MKVLKFGGSSVSTPEAVGQVSQIIRKESEAGPVTVVVSAMGKLKKGEKKVTDQLIDMGKMASDGNEDYQASLQQLIDRHHQMMVDVLSGPECEGLEEWFARETAELTGLLNALTYTKELSLQVLDRIMSFGERLSAGILAAALRSQNISAEYLDTRPIIKTRDQFGEAQVEFSTSNELIRKHFEGRKNIQVATGFIGSTSGNRETTLGRNGSDFTAAILASALDATEIQIWKDDVIGVMTANPDKVEGAETIAHLTYREAGELAHQGMGAVHSATMIPAQEKNIPIIVKSTRYPDHPGTRIDGEQNGDRKVVKGVSSMSDVTQFNITGLGMRDKKGLLSRVSGALAQANISISFFVQLSSEQAMSFTIPKEEAEIAEAALRVELARELGEHGGIKSIERNDQRTVIAIVGEKMRGQKGTLATVTSSLAKNGINIVSIGQTPDEFNITVIVDKGKEERALRAVHNAFLHGDKKVLHLFLVGAGNIGKKLLEQIQEREEDEKIEIRIVGIVNSKRAILNILGIPLADWEKQLEKGKDQSFKDAFLEMKDMELPNTVFVDLTSDEAVARFHPAVLYSSTAVVSANKTGLSAEQQLHDETMAAAEEGKVPMKRETTVGAGLPVMVTLESFRNSGDKVEKIMAVLSGTLSFLFNTYDGSEPFSQLVRRAKELKYTEPNPKDDLNLKDVARKLLILAREAGGSMEMEEIEIEHFLSSNALEAETVEAFFTALEQVDDVIMAKKYHQAHAEGKVLRCVATLENGKAKLGLQAVDARHPLYSLAGSDNKISFVTKRYPAKTPLTIQGPGAGPDVTAAGVLYDILQVANYFS